MLNKFFSRGSVKRNESEKWLFGTMLVFGITGLIAAFTLAVEEFELLKDPNAVLSCSFNLVLNCATVMKTWQASVFGFPNMFVGLMGFPIIIAIALLGLSHTKFPRWFLFGAEIGFALSFLFAQWLFFNSLYDIQVLCPWCLIVTFSTTVLFATITRYNMQQNTFQLSKQWNKKFQVFLEKDYDKLLIATWLVVLVALVFSKFGDALFA